MDFWVGWGNFVSLRGTEGDAVVCCLIISLYKFLKLGFLLPINSNFFFLEPALICFSLSIAELGLLQIS